MGLTTKLSQVYGVSGKFPVKELSVSLSGSWKLRSSVQRTKVNQKRIIEARGFKSNYFCETAASSKGCGTRSKIPLAVSIVFCSGEAALLSPAVARSAATTVFGCKEASMSRPAKAIDCAHDISALGWRPNNSGLSSRGKVRTYRSCSLNSSDAGSWERKENVSSIHEYTVNITQGGSH